MITVIGNKTLCRSVIILVIKQLGLPLRGRPILFITRMISIGNSMIISDIWLKYHEWYFEIVTRPVYVVSRAVRRVKFETILKYHEWSLCQISRTTHAIQVCLYYYPQKVCNFHM